jgi:chromosome segregation and condensation protein ScpB
MAFASEFVEALYRSGPRAMLEKEKMVMLAVIALAVPIV